MTVGRGCCQMTGSSSRKAERLTPWMTTAVRLSIAREERSSWSMGRGLETAHSPFTIGSSSIAGWAGEVLVRVEESGAGSGVWPAAAHVTLGCWLSETTTVSASPIIRNMGMLSSAGFIC